MIPDTQPTKTSEEKKVYMLLKSVIFYYHGLDELEKQDLAKTADELDAHDEYQWAIDFISADFITAFDRAREYLNEQIYFRNPHKETKKKTSQ